MFKDTKVLHVLQYQRNLKCNLDMQPTNITGAGYIISIVTKIIARLSWPYKKIFCYIILLMMLFDLHKNHLYRSLPIQ